MVRPIALGMAATHLAAGDSVIMPQFLDAEDEALLFRRAATEAGAGFSHFVGHQKGLYRRMNLRR
ncbi:hypothetical protein [Arthrobacter sp. Rue61a]|uniref:hypothetical protein n=1 Tax=Arthrobacter sp. Rue61a TaxID=1118963 RepID=UPI0002D76549|nr:hypothetical protein [Arthrobacter sp. Rue61a]